MESAEPETAAGQAVFTVRIYSNTAGKAEQTATQIDSVALASEVGQCRRASSPSIHMSDHGLSRRRCTTERPIRANSDSCTGRLRWPVPHAEPAKKRQTARHRLEFPDARRDPLLDERKSLAEKPLNVATGVKTTDVDMPQARDITCP
jgi:hypothetical protein